MNPQPSFNQHLTAWKWAVSGKSHSPIPLEIGAASLDEFQNWQAQLQATKIEAEKAKYKCQFNKGGTQSGRMAAWITCNGFTLKIAFTAKSKRAQDVKPTSIEAYHTIDFTTQRDRIAEIIWQYRNYDKGITRKEIEVFHDFGSNAVTGRVKELLEMSAEKPFRLGGGLYRLEVVGTRLSLCKGASRVPNEVLQWMPVKQPADEGAQIEMNF